MRLLVSNASGLSGIGASLWAQTPATISLAQAQDIAVRNHPRHCLGRLYGASRRIGGQGGSLGLISHALRRTSPASEPNTNSVLSAGAVTTSSIYNRAATGIVVTSIAHRLRTHRQPGAEREAAQCLPKPERDQHPRPGIDRGSADILSGARFRVCSQRSRRRRSISGV